MSETSELPDARELAALVEEACGGSPTYHPDFELVTEENERLRSDAAAERLRKRGPNPVVNAVLQAREEGGYRLVYERIASASRFDEPWPAPAASVVELDSEMRVVERRDYGGFIRD